ncbi:type III PLP-dependent enzyme [Streptomyces sp. 7N604]|uniref:type III PLP-dependent enzyme n=1 Tax=Streptomyces sp. 7N604 TaxID=3457415 RepID=UPI003FCFBCB6
MTASEHALHPGQQLDLTGQSGLTALPTPAYVYELEAVRAAHEQLVAALPHPSTLFYSLKANPHPALVRELARLGCSAEISSRGELHAALQADVAPHRILYSGPGKRDDDVVAAARAGVRWFSVDSPRGLDQVRRAAEATSIPLHSLLRVHAATPLAGRGLAMAGGPTSLGADAEWIEGNPDCFRDGIHGLHLFLGSNFTAEADLIRQFEVAIASARHLYDVLGLPLERLDLGGGFGAPFAQEGTLPSMPNLAKAVADLLDDAIPTWRDGRPEVVFESGRYLVSTCGTLLSQVLDVKESQGTPVVVLESGINHLGGMSGLRRIPWIVPHFDGPAEREPGPGSLVTGPLCSPLDCLAREADVGRLRPGDILRIPNTGAYGLTASLVGFLSHPQPLEIVTDGGRVVSTTRLAMTRETLDPAVTLANMEVT